MKKQTFVPYNDILPPEQQKCWQLLQNISTLGYVLYGGTALALRLGHRQSVDFDFFTHADLNREALFDAYPFLSYGDRLQDEGNTLTLKIDDSDFKSPVKISFFGQIDFGRVGVPEIAGESGILVASLDDIMALKLKVLLQRVEEKDYIDIAEMIDNGVSLTKGLASASEFFGPSFQPSIALQTLVWFEDLSEKLLTQKYRNILVQAVESLRIGTDQTYQQIQKMSDVLTDDSVTLSICTKNSGRRR